MKLYLHHYTITNYTAYNKISNKLDLWYDNDIRYPLHNYLNLFIIKEYENNTPQQNVIIPEENGGWVQPIPNREIKSNPR